MRKTLAVISQVSLASRQPRSKMERAPASEFAFSSLARALNARALEGSTAPSDSRWAFAFNSSGLTPDSKAALLNLPGSELGDNALWIDGAELEQLASSDQAAACFLESRRGFERIPGRPKLMGVLNLTPDSFSDGGRYSDLETAIARAHELVAEGAEIVDVGGESTRPGAPPVSEEEELARVLPLIRAFAPQTKVQISIDTTKASVARQAIAAGCKVVNDVSGGLFDPEILRVVADSEATYVCMHTLGRPETMQQDVHYEDPTAEVCGALRARVEACLEAKISLDKIVVDPGIGFGKRLADNLDLLKRLSELRSLGLPILMGVSRKSFIGQLNQGVSGAADTESRLGGTAAAIAACVAGGAEFLRVHDVAAMSEAARVAYAIGSPNPFTAS